ncbi:MAG: class I tRNA ligase family protein, partial [Thermomicrobiales bacterium]|nr:class I tRNA ligase family protein [Thermomicrobiales bacterium]
QELADRNSAVFRGMVEAVGSSNDQFIRTTEDRHKRACQAIWQRMADNGDIYLDRYSGWYSVRQEAYFDESETTLGEDGVRREPLGSPVEWNEEETYFFRLSAYQDKLLELYESQPDFIGPAERRNEVMSFVKSGLRDLSVSRSTFKWGVPVPGDEKHVMYVWVDALTNYLTGAGFPDTESDLYQRYWPADLHMIGKDIIRFHTVYWPAFLMSAGIPLPRRVFAHGFLYNRGEKMSKSIGNLVSIKELIRRGDERAFRLLVLQSIYRNPLVFNDEVLEGARRGLERLDTAVRGYDATTDANDADAERAAAEADTRFRSAMDDDFNTPIAMSVLFDLSRSANRAEGAAKHVLQAKLVQLAGVLGLRLGANTSSGTGDAAPFIDLLISIRDELRAAKQWTLSDRIRDELAERGIIVEDSADGATWRRKD